MALSIRVQKQSLLPADPSPPAKPLPAPPQRRSKRLSQNSAGDQGIFPTSSGAQIQVRQQSAGVVLPAISGVPHGKFSSQLPEVHFARRYTVEKVTFDPKIAKQFVRDYLRREGEFFAIARNPQNGLTYDGVNLDPATGKVMEPRRFSAASKECLDLAILTKAVSGHPMAAELMGRGSPQRAKTKAIEILTKKLTSYRQYLADFPGFGGMLPWFQHDPVQPLPEWQNAVPSLDVGEWLFSMLAVESALRKAGYHELAGQFAAHNETLRKKAISVFWDAKERRVRGGAYICQPRGVVCTDQRAAPDSLIKHMKGEHAVHEGVMILWFISLFGHEIPREDRDAMWEGTAAQRVDTEFGSTWQAYWGSSHESWSALIAPNRHHPLFRELFSQREMIRTQNAHKRGYPGLAASINPPDGASSYIGAAGIEGIGTQPVTHNDVFAPYAAFPTLLEFSDKPNSPNYGLGWLVNMLQGPRQQTAIGGGESGRNDGTAAAAMKTIDGSFPNVLALMGGVADEVADALRQRGKYDEFLQLVDKQYRPLIATKPLLKGSGFALPRTKIPTDRLAEYAEKKEAA